MHVFRRSLGSFLLNIVLFLIIALIGFLVSFSIFIIIALDLLVLGGCCALLLFGKNHVVFVNL